MAAAADRMVHSMIGSCYVAASTKCRLPIFTLYHRDIERVMPRRRVHDVETWVYRRVAGGGQGHDNNDDSVADSRGWIAGSENPDRECARLMQVERTDRELLEFMT